MDAVAAYEHGDHRGLCAGDRNEVTAVKRQQNRRLREWQVNYRQFFSLTATWKRCASGDIGIRNTVIAFKYVMITNRVRCSSVYTTPPEGWQKGSIVTVKVKRCDKNEKHDCGAGINVASKAWCLQYRGCGDRIIQLRVAVCDIVAMPVHRISWWNSVDRPIRKGTAAGKFRCKRAEVIN